MDEANQRDDWTVGALKEHLEAMLDERDARLQDGAGALRSHVELQIAEVIAVAARLESDVVNDRVKANGLELERIASVKSVLDQFRDDIVDRIDAGDLRLREHVAAQVGQIAAALEAARRETDVAATAQEKAIEKSETATDKRFDGVNGLREQLAAQSASFMPREVAEAQIADLRRAIGELTEKLGKIA